MTGIRRHLHRHSGTRLLESTPARSMDSGLDAARRPGMTIELVRRKSPLPSAIDLAAHDRDGLLIDLGGIPGLDGGEIGFAGLVAGAGAPAVDLQKICRRAQRVGGDV